MSDETKPEIPQDLSQFLPTTKTPNKDVISALWAYVLAQVEKAQSISAEARERVTNQSELAGLNRKAFNTVMSAIRKGKKHQFEAIEDLKHALRLYIEVRGIDKVLPLIRPRAQVRELDLAEVTRG